MLEFDVELPVGTLQPAGYVLMSFGVRDRRPLKAYDTRLRKIPTVHRTKVLSKKIAAHRRAVEVGQDPNCLATLKHYRSLMPMAMGAHKPMFALKTSDGAIGAHQEAVRGCYQDFLTLARRIAAAVGLPELGSEDEYAAES